jgi:microsomal epoxide hydrolase
MPNSFASIPKSAILHPVPFHVEVPEAKLDQLKLLLTLSRIAPATFEGRQEDGKYGVSVKWLTQAKEYWENGFDW